MLSWEKLGPVYLCTKVIDMRSGFDRLSELVQAELGQDPLGGGVFVFVGRSRRRVKILVWERDGYWLLYKRLEVGVFRVSFCDGYEEISGVDLKRLLEGMDLSRIKFCKDVQKRFDAKWEYGKTSSCQMQLYKTKNKFPAPNTKKS